MRTHAWLVQLIYLREILDTSTNNYFCVSLLVVMFFLDKATITIIHILLLYLNLQKWTYRLWPQSSKLIWDPHRFWVPDPYRFWVPHPSPRPDWVPGCRRQYILVVQYTNSKKIILSHICPPRSRTKSEWPRRCIASSLTNTHSKKIDSFSYMPTTIQNKPSTSRVHATVQLLAHKYA